MSDAMQVPPGLGGSAFEPRGGTRSYTVIASEDDVRRAAIARALAHDGHAIATPRAALEFFTVTGIAGPDLRYPGPPAAVILDTTGRDWATPALLEVAGGHPWRLPIIALVADAAGAARARDLGAAATLRLPLDLPLLRAEVMAMVSPATRGAA